VSPIDDFPSLTELLAGVRAGDEDAKAELYNRHYREFLQFTGYYLWLRGCLDPSRHVHGVNTLAWIRVWECCATQLRNDESFQSWVRTIISNLVTEHVSGPRGCVEEGRRRVPFLEVEERSIPAELIPADEALINAERWERVLTTAATINKKLPAIIILRVKDFDFEEIARRVGVSRVNARNIFYRGLAKLELLLGDGKDSPDAGVAGRGEGSAAGDEEDEGGFWDDDGAANDRVM
jgi:RNA polymerase sigma factor (sigma-70 family)